MKMIEALPESTGTCIGIRVSGTVTSQDYREFLERARTAIEEHGKANLVVVFDDFKFIEGWDVFTADLSFALGEYRHIERAAYVGDRGWEKMLVQLVGLFTRARERNFPTNELQAAWSWACGTG
jgi:hypothetical protein